MKKKCYTLLIILVFTGGMFVLNKNREGFPLRTNSTEIVSIIQDRIAVMCYMGSHESEARIFLTMLFGSWKFMTDRKQQLIVDEKFRGRSNIIDLVVFCEPHSCKYISEVCTVVEGIKDIVTKIGTPPTCWSVYQRTKIDIQYTPLNSYIMFMRKDVSHLKRHYKYLLRSDYDVFLSPGLFLFKTENKLLVGQGGYSGPFPNRRLKSIAKKLGMRYQGFHSVGSTWYGETDFFIKAGKLAYRMTRYMFLNEFNRNNPEIRKFFLKNPMEGEWPFWWRPVSSMYGGELAVNHLVDGISDKIRGRFDTSSCEVRNIWTAVHIHCWHNDCEFQKHRFINYLNMIIRSSNGIPGRILHLIVENTYPKDITKMNIREYTMHIAWYSVGRYLRKWIVKNAPVPKNFPHDMKKP